MKKESEKKGKRKLKKGKILSISGDKTVLVEVLRKVRHPRYGKTIIRRKKFMAHNEENKAQVGDRVTIEEIAPLSCRKRWKVVRKEE